MRSEIDVFIYPDFSCNVMQFQICLIAQQIKGHISFCAAPKERGTALLLGREGGVSDPELAWMKGQGSTEAHFLNKAVTVYSE